MTPTHIEDDTMTDNHIIANVDALLEAAKRVKNSRIRYEVKEKRISDAHKAIQELSVEANALTAAMVNGEDISEMRDLGTIHKELQKAHTAYDRALDGGEKERNEMQEALAVIRDSVNGRVAPTPVEDTTDVEEAA